MILRSEKIVFIIQGLILLIGFPNAKYPPNTKNYLPCLVIVGGTFSIRRKGLMVILVTTTMIDMIVTTGTIEMINDDSKNANMAKRSIVRKLPSYGRMSRGSLVMMFIMSSSCEQHSEQKQFVTTK